MHYTEDEIVGTATHHGQDYSFEFALPRFSNLVLFSP